MKKLKNAKTLLDPSLLDFEDEQFKKIAEKLRTQRKDKTLTIRVNGDDLQRLKDKAAALGVKYQTFIAEILHQLARR